MAPSSCPRCGTPPTSRSVFCAPWWLVSCEDPDCGGDPDTTPEPPFAFAASRDAAEAAWEEAVAEWRAEHGAS